MRVAAYLPLFLVLAWLILAIILGLRIWQKIPQGWSLEANLGSGMSLIGFLPLIVKLAHSSTMLEGGWTIVALWGCKALIVLCLVGFSVGIICSVAFGLYFLLGSQLLVWGSLAVLGMVTLVGIFVILGGVRDKNSREASRQRSVQIAVVTGQALVGIYHTTIIKMGHVIEPVLWLNAGANKRLDITSASIVSSAHNSVLVSHESLGQNVFKILDKAAFDREARMQSIAYGLGRVRQMLAQGPVAGCGTGLSGLLLEGFYSSHLNSSHIEKLGLLEVSNQLYTAFKSLHHRGVYHRDLKPANFYCDLESQQVKISDLGSACSSSDPTEILSEESGSEMFRMGNAGIVGSKSVIFIPIVAICLALVVGLVIGLYLTMGP